MSERVAAGTLLLLIGCAGHRRMRGDAGEDRGADLGDAGMADTAADAGSDTAADMGTMAQGEEPGVGTPIRFGGAPVGGGDIVLLVYPEDCEVRTVRVGSGEPVAARVLVEPRECFYMAAPRFIDVDGDGLYEVAAVTATLVSEETAAQQAWLLEGDTLATRWTSGPLASEAKLGDDDEDPYIYNELDFGLDIDADGVPDLHHYRYGDGEGGVHSYALASTYDQVVEAPFRLRGFDPMQGIAWADAWETAVDLDGDPGVELLADADDVVRAVDYPTLKTSWEFAESEGAHLAGLVDWDGVAPREVVVRVGYDYYEYRVVRAGIAVDSFFREGEKEFCGAVGQRVDVDGDGLADLAGPTYRSGVTGEIVGSSSLELEGRAVMPGLEIPGALADGRRFLVGFCYTTVAVLSAPGLEVLDRIVTIPPDDPSSVFNVFLDDFDGDGWDDVLVNRDDSPGLFRGPDWDLAWTLTEHVANARLDVDGDGLADIETLHGYSAGREQGVIYFRGDSAEPILESRVQLIGRQL